ncbi:MAG: hypothetical protein HZA91_16935 [Verrucomicrobia bacterium]|nr:hypothetical protein [Verrucomicrobiota bacterium]
MSKKKRKPSPPKVRRLWTIKPVERVKPSEKVYSRKKAAASLHDAMGQ